MKRGEWGGEVIWMRNVFLVVVVCTVIDVIYVQVGIVVFQGAMD